MQQSPKLTDVRAFLALAQTGSFAAAGKLLGRDPTAITRSIQALERHLGVRLAERTTRANALTEAGRAYATRVAPLLHDFEVASEEAAAMGNGEPRGHLKVSLPGSFARLWMAPLITGFLAAHPRVSLAASYTNALVDIVGGGFDVAVRLAALADSRLFARKVASRRRLVCAAPAYLDRRGPPREPEDVARHDCLCFTGRQSPFIWTFAGACGEKRSVFVSARIESDDADILVEGAVAGLGLFYTTDWHVGSYLADGRLVEVMTQWPVPDDGGIYIVTPSIAGLPSKTRAFSDWVAQGLARRPWLSRTTP